MLWEIIESLPKPMHEEKHARRAWILDETWRLVNECTALQHKAGHDCAKARQLSHRI